MLLSLCFYKKILFQSKRFLLERERSALWSNRFCRIELLFESKRFWLQKEGVRLCHIVSAESHYCSKAKDSCLETKRIGLCQILSAASYCFTSRDSSFEAKGAILCFVSAASYCSSQAEDSGFQAPAEHPNFQEGGVLTCDLLCRTTSLCTSGRSELSSERRCSLFLRNSITQRYPLRRRRRNFSHSLVLLPWVRPHAHQACALLP